MVLLLPCKNHSPPLLVCVPLLIIPASSKTCHALPASFPIATMDFPKYLSADLSKSVVVASTLAIKSICCSFRLPMLTCLIASDKEPYFSTSVSIVSPSRLSFLRSSSCVDNSSSFAPESVLTASDNFIYLLASSDISSLIAEASSAASFVFCLLSSSS